MNKIDYYSIGARIRKQRELLKLSREQLATELDVTSKFISDIELGQKGMSIKTLIALSKVLSIPTDFILFGVNPTSATSPEDKIYLTSANPIADSDKLSFITNYIAENFEPKEK